MRRYVIYDHFQFTVFNFDVFGLDGLFGLMNKQLVSFCVCECFYFVVRFSINSKSASTRKETHFIFLFIVYLWHYNIRFVD